MGNLGNGANSNSSTPVSVLGLQTRANAPVSVAIDGPSVGVVNTSFTFTATVGPISSTQPITYVWQATGLAPFVHTGGLSDNAAFSWPTPGLLTVVVTASNAAGQVSAVKVVTINVPTTISATLMLITPSPANAFLGAPITVSVAITNVSNLGSFEYTLNYSPTQLQIQAVTLGEFLGSTGRTPIQTGPVINNPAGSATFGAFTLGGSSGPSGGGTLAYVRLLPLTAGLSVLQFNGAQATDVSGIIITTTTQDGGILTTQGVMSVSPVSTTVFSGMAFTVGITISNVANMGSFEYTLHFSPTLLQVQAVTLGEFLGSTGRTTSQTGPVISNTAGSVTFGAFTLGGSAGPSGAGNLAYVRLMPLTAGASPLQLSDVQATDVPGNILALGTQDGAVLIRSCLGDFDNNGKVDIVDVQRVAYRWGSKVGDGLYSALYDVDGNGKIDIVDVQRVAYRWGTSCSIAGPVRAQVALRPTASVTLTAAPAQGLHTPGATFTTSMRINGASGLGSFEFTLAYSPTLLQALSVTLGTFPGSTGRNFVANDVVISATAGTVNYSAFSLGSIPAGASGNGDLAIVTFKALAVGTSMLQPIAGQTTDEPGNPQDTGLQSTPITIANLRFVYMPIVALP